MISKELSDYFSRIGAKGGSKSKGGGRKPIYKTDEERKAARKETQRKYRESKKARKEEKTMLEVNGCLKMTEQDDYQEGCLPETGNSVWIDYHWKADTKDDIIRQLMEFVGVNEGDDAVELDACGEQGRIDISQTENADGNDPSPTQYDLWKKGQEKLWYCTYSFKVEKVQRTAFAMA